MKETFDNINYIDSDIVLIDRYYMDTIVYQGATLTNKNDYFKLRNYIKNTVKFYKLPIPNKMFFIDYFPSKNNQADDIENNNNIQFEAYKLYKTECPPLIKIKREKKLNNMEYVKWK